MAIDITDRYLIRLRQLDNGQKEIYEGERDNIIEVLKAYDRYKQ